MSDSINSLTFREFVGPDEIKFQNIEVGND